MQSNEEISLYVEDCSCHVGNNGEDYQVNLSLDEIQYLMSVSLVKYHKVWEKSCEGDPEVSFFDEHLNSLSNTQLLEVLLGDNYTAMY